jgi:hypothetical protein
LAVSLLRRMSLAFPCLANSKFRRVGVVLLPAWEAEDNTMKLGVAEAMKSQKPRVRIVIWPELRCPRPSWDFIKAGLVMLNTRCAWLPVRGNHLGYRGRSRSHQSGGKQVAFHVCPFSFGLALGLTRKSRTCHHKPPHSITLFSEPEGFQGVRRKLATLLTT